MPSGSDSYIRASLNSGNWRAPVGEPYLYTHAFSVRCVLDLNTADGLQLCDYQPSSSYGAAQCRGYSGGCQGAATGNSDVNNCYPHIVWTVSKTDIYHQGYRLYGGVLGYASGTCSAGMYGKCTLPYALSVRCVLGLST